MVWRIWYWKHATLREIEEWYSLDDVIAANTILDAADEEERLRNPPDPTV